jgi:CubicO group peptidase (beta-lactamase class C family)
MQMPLYASRREFLKQTALGSSVLALGGCAHRRAANPQESRGRPSVRWFADLEKQILDSAAKHTVPGVSVAVVRDAQVVWSRGLGVQEHASHVAIHEASVFEAASMSKPVFAYAVMKMCERGVINLDTPLSTYTPERFLSGDPRLDLITARHVLSQAVPLSGSRFSPAAVR